MVLDEIHHARLTGTRGSHAERHRELQASILQLVGDNGQFSLGVSGGRTIQTRHMAVILIGAFTGLGLSRQHASVAALVAAGILPELASRVQHILVCEPPRLTELETMLRAAPQVAALQAIAARLGLEVTILDETYRRLALAVHRQEAGATQRQGPAALTAAIRIALIQALGAGCVGGKSILIAPDDLALPITTHPDRPE